MVRSVNNKKAPTFIARVLRPKVAMVAIVLVALVRFFLCDSYTINDSAMDSLFFSNKQKSDRIIYIRYLFPIFKPSRGDVVLYKYPSNSENYKRGYFTARVAGMPSERILIKKNRLNINGKEEISEPFKKLKYILTKNMAFGNVFSRKKIPKDSYYILGDNSLNSHDSRYLGAINKSDIIGKIIFIYWPFNKISII